MICGPPWKRAGTHCYQLEYTGVHGGAECQGGTEYATRRRLAPKRRVAAVDAIYGQRASTRGP